MLNKITIMGRLTADPVLRYTQSNTPVTSFTVAVDRDFGGKEKQTDFFNCVAWRHTAEFVSKYFVKGDMAVVSGSMQMRNYEDKKGDKRTAWELLTESVYFGSTKRDKAAVNVEFEELPDEGDLPF